jgi:hypothetical protein
MFSATTLPRVFRGRNGNTDVQKDSLTLHVDGIDNSTSSTLSTISCASAGTIDSNACDDIDESHINYYSAVSILNSSENAVGDVTANTIATDTRTRKKSVRFGSLEIHEHGVVLGGSGVPRNGPPTTLEREAHTYHMIKSVEVFDDNRPDASRRGSELLYPKKQRVDMLLEAGHTLSEINRSIRENDAIRSNRMTTIRTSKRFSALSKILRCRRGGN